MKKINLFLLGTSMCILAVFTSCNKEAAKTVAGTTQANQSTAVMIAENGSNPDEVIMTTSSSGASVLTETNSVEYRRSPKGHYLYTEANEAGTNRIYTYQVNTDGTLFFQGSVALGGLLQEVV